MLLSVNFSTVVLYPWYIEPPPNYGMSNIQLTSLVVMGTDYISRCKSTLAAQVNGRLFAIMTDIIFKKKKKYIKAYIS